MVGRRWHPGARALADALLSTGRLTGLASADLLLVQVLLMARVPVLERAYGQDRLARLHRLVGFTGLSHRCWRTCSSSPGGTPPAASPAG
ncbi:MAG: hypothetical protein R2734_07460 [Nocardioides sp.]